MKKINILVLSFFTAAMITVSGLYVRQINTTEKYKSVLKSSYTKAMYNLSESLNNISTDLKKTTYITTPKTFSSYAAKIYCEAEIAKEALSKLPGDHTRLETVNLFLSQVGNYALSLSKDLISGGILSESQKENLVQLAQTADTVSKAVEDTKITLNNAEYWSSEIEEKVNKSVDSKSLASSLTELEEKLTDYPTLIYDGPYSDHILNKKPLMLANKPEISRERALLIAKSVSGNDTLQMGDASLQGKIECYTFLNESVSVSISKHGGFPVYMLKTRDIGDKGLKTEALTSRAQKFLEDNGFSNMTLTYFESRDGLMTCNFAYLDGITVCYTDLIKVGIAEDTGEIISIETVGFLTNHTIRVFDAPKYSEEEARGSLSAGLEPENAKYALIPTAGGAEVRCYEFKCTAENDQILVYVNMSTLECQDVFIMLTNKNGTLVK